MNRISPSRFFVSWFRAVLVAGALGPSIAPAQTADTGTESTSATAGSHTTPPASADSSALVSPRTASVDAFYVRAGVAVDWSNDARFTDKDCLGTFRPALYGSCDPGTDGAPISSAGDFGTMAGFEFGIGRRVAPTVRIEGIVQHRPKFSFEGRSNFTQDRTYMRRVTADLSSVSAMVAAYLDGAEIVLPGLGPLRPFAGGGVGLARIRIDETSMGHPDARTTTFVPEGSRVNLVWMLTAGVASRLGDRTTLDLAWRYTDSGDVETGRARGRVVWRDGSRDPIEFDVGETRARLSSHGLTVSVRYAF